MKTVKKISLFGIPIYELREGEFSKEQVFFGVTIRRRYLNSTGWHKRLFGWHYDHKPIPTSLIIKPYKCSLGRLKKYREREPKELLIVLPPAIGDNVMLHNFLREIKNSEKYKGFRLVVLGRDIYRPFSECWDNGVIDQYLYCGENISVGKPNFAQLVRVKIRLERQGMKRYYHTIIFASHLFNDLSHWCIDAHLVNKVTSEERIGFCAIQKQCRTDLFLYNTKTVLCYDDVRRCSVIDISRYFFGKILGKNLDYVSSSIDVKYEEKKADQTSKYIVLSPCASTANAKNMWHQHNWCKLLLQLYDKTKLDVVIICGGNQTSYCKDLANMIKALGINAEVKADLKAHELLSVLGGAECYLTVDSGIFHVAAGMGNVKTVCVSSGHNYLRWLMYAEKMPNVRIVTPPGWKEWFLSKCSDPLFDYPLAAYTFINAVQINDVAEAVCDLLNIQD